MNLKVAAYITCYQDQESASKCIQAIKYQSIKVTTIYIVDNSSKPLSLDENAALLLVHYYPNNIGIAEGLAKALEWATDEDYDFLWTFDQDSVPTQNCLEILLATYNKVSQLNKSNIGIIAPTVIDITTGKVIGGGIFTGTHFIEVKHNKNVDFYECDSPITSGSLISITAAKNISPPCIDLFIDGIDLDFGLRLKYKGFTNLIVPQAIMYHNFGNPIKIKFFRRSRYIQKYSALRHYYICRNHTYLETRYAKGRYIFTSLIWRIKYMFSTLLGILLYDSEARQLKIWACLLGTYHGLTGRLGKIWH